MIETTIRCIRTLAVAALVGVLTACPERTLLAPATAPVVAANQSAAPTNEPEAVPHGRLETINGYRMLTLDGTPAQMGRAAGELLGPTIRRVVKAMIADGIGRDPEAYDNILTGSKIMETCQPEDYLEELKAMAEAAEVAYDDLLLLQYFGDVRRAITGPGHSALCTSFAVLPDLTKDNTCIVGRNFDYFDHGVGDYASLLVYYRPEGKIPFVTVTWAGIINGWTLMSREGIVVSNNTAFAGTNSLKGISTCFLLRYVVERARSVKEGIDLVRRARRACGTNMLIASGTPPDAAIVEFDANGMEVRRPVSNFVGADNSFRVLGQPKEEKTEPGEEMPEDCLCNMGRLGNAMFVINQHIGKVDLSTNLAGADGVPIEGMNLHSVNIDATNLRMRLAMGSIPACKLPYRAFRLTAKGLLSDEAPPLPGEAPE